MLPPPNSTDTSQGSSVSSVTSSGSEQDEDFHALLPELEYHFQCVTPINTYTFRVGLHKFSQYFNCPKFIDYIADYVEENKPADHNLTTEYIRNIDISEEAVAEMNEYNRIKNGLKPYELLLFEIPKRSVKGERVLRHINRLGYKRQEMLKEHIRKDKKSYTIAFCETVIKIFE